MSVWRIKRQISYLFFILLLIVFLIGTIYFIVRSPASCFDSRQNQDETDIDCGGSCERVCSVGVRPLNVLWTRAFKIRPNSYTAVALIENENINEGVEHLPYIIKLFDQSGQEIMRRYGSTKISPREKVAIFESNVIVDNRQVTRAFIDFPESIFWREVNLTKPLIRVSPKDYNNNPTPILSALVTNESNDDLTNIRVVVVLADDTGNAYSASATLIDHLSRQSSREIFFTWPMAFPLNPTFIDFYPKVLDPESSSYRNSNHG